MNIIGWKMKTFFTLLTLKIVQNDKDYSIQNLHRADKKYSLICKIHKIEIPKQSENQTIMHSANQEKHVQS